MLLEWLLETCSTECFLFKKVKCECYASECYAVDFTDSKNLRNKKKIMVLAIIVAEIGKVNCMVTWPWGARSCMTDTLLITTDLNFFIIQWWELRKNRRDSIRRGWNSHGHINMGGGIESRHRSRSSDKVTTLKMFFRIVRWSEHRKRLKQYKYIIDTVSDII